MTPFGRKTNIIFFYGLLNISVIINAFSIHSLLINNLDIQGLKNDIHLKLKHHHQPVSYKYAKKLLSNYDFLRIYEQDNCQLV